MESGTRTGDRSYSTAEIYERVARAANGYRAAGLREGDVVAIMLRNDVAFIDAMLAANHGGIYSVPINWHFKAREVDYILRDCGARLLIIHADLLWQLGERLPSSIRVMAVTVSQEIAKGFSIPPERCVPPPGYLEWERWLQGFSPVAGPPASTRGSISYTSGSTGLPKGVRREPVRTEDQEEYQRLRAAWFGFRRGMRTAIIGPLYHSVQATYAIAAVRAAGVAVLTPRFDPEELLRLIEAERLTHLHLVPTMMNRLVQLPEAVRRRYGHASLEFVVHGAAPCSPTVKRALIEWWGPIVHEYYGTTEAGMISRSNSEEWLAREGTVGRAWPSRVIRIYDADGMPLPPNTPGEIYMSLGVMPNFTYHNADDKRREIERDGLVTNGDTGYLDEDGYLFLCGRKHDVAICGGVNVYPAETEAVLITHPAVFDCAVFPIPHADLGEVLAAAVQLRESYAATEQELESFLRERIAGIKVPRRIEIRDSLPRDPSGKIFKQALRAPYGSGATPPPRSMALGAEASPS